MKGPDKGISFLWFVIFLGAVFGSLIGDTLGDRLGILNFLKDSYTIGTSTPTVLNLKILVLTLGLNFNINVMTIIGIIMAIILYRRCWGSD